MSEFCSQHGELMKMVKDIHKSLVGTANGQIIGLAEQVRNNEYMVKRVRDSNKWVIRTLVGLFGMLIGSITVVLIRRAIGG